MLAMRLRSLMVIWASERNLNPKLKTPNPYKRPAKFGHTNYFAKLKMVLEEAGFANSLLNAILMMNDGAQE